MGTRTAPPGSRWYGTSLRWRAHKSPQSQGRGIRPSSSEFITPDPDFTEEAEEDMNDESAGTFQFDEPLELSGAHYNFWQHISVAYTLLYIILYVLLWTRYLYEHVNASTGMR